MDRSLQWAVRCVHESKLHKQNCFITLTYDDENLPHSGTLCKKDFQQFIKNLRQKIAPMRFRFFHAGEYGTENNRPHYHALLFNLDFKDRKLYKIDNKVKIYTSKFLDSIWKKGFTTVGDLTMASCAYVARYVIKKHSRAEDYYYKIDEERGEIQRIEQEYCTMSNRPGIGHKFFQKYKKEIYPDDFIVIKGTRHKVPKYYDYQLEKTNKKIYNSIKIKRKYQASKNAENNTQQRLAVREKIKNSKNALLKRKI